MLGTLQPGDRLLVSELKRLGRSRSQVIQIVETLVQRQIRAKLSTREQTILLNSYKQRVADRRNVGGDRGKTSLQHPA